MVDIRHRVGITAPQAEVFEALATREGFSRWWTPRVRGEAGPGGRLEFYFNGDDPAAVMQVQEVEPARHVAMNVVAGPEEWVGTQVRFDLAEHGGETVVLFTHANWREPVEFMAHCSMKWSQFLMSLKTGLEGGRYLPFPDDPKISSWG